MKMTDGALARADEIERSYGPPVLALRLDSALDQLVAAERVQAAIATLGSAGEVHVSVDVEPPGVIVRQWGFAPDIGETLAALARRRSPGMPAVTRTQRTWSSSSAPRLTARDLTDNVADYEAARLAHETADGPHYGVIYALAPAFNRHRGDQVIGPIVRALDRFLDDHPGEEPLNAAHYLRPAVNER